MTWIRGEAKRLSLLALFALVIQFGLCFGHTHAHFAWPSSTQQAIATSSGAAHGGVQPDDDALCPICRAAAMITSATHATPPILPIPAAFAAVDFASQGGFTSSLFRLIAFQSRAPPLI